MKAEVSITDTGEFVCEVDDLGIQDHTPPLEHRASVGCEVTPVLQKQRLFAKFSTPVLPHGDYVLTFMRGEDSIRLHFPTTEAASVNGRMNFFVLMNPMRG